MLNGTTVVYSHDDARNAGHTVNDVMNVWLLLWLTRIAPFVTDLPLLNIDAFNLGHNFHDDVRNPFYLTYNRSFRALLGAESLGRRGVVCLERVVLQPQPAKWFVWDSWFADSACSSTGPSSLFQRWNLQVLSVCRSVCLFLCVLASLAAHSSRVSSCVYMYCICILSCE